jgi:hypothetical protein
MLCSPKIWADQKNLTLKEFNCLTHDEKVDIAASYDQLFVCHQALIEASKPQPTAWSTIGLAILAGAILGIVAQQELKH